MGVKILSAAKGEGKTSFLCKCVAFEVDRGRSVGGVASPAVFGNGRRVGYDLIDLRRGSRRLLARAATSNNATPDVGMFGFDEAAVSEGNAAIISAVKDGLDVIAVDEVGPLEFDGKGWAPALESALRECGPQQELIVVIRPSLLEDLPSRFPSPLWTVASRISPPWPSLILPHSLDHVVE